MAAEKRTILKVKGASKLVLFTRKSENQRAAGQLVEMSFSAKCLGAKCSMTYELKLQCQLLMSNMTFRTIVTFETSLGVFLGHNDFFVWIEKVPIL
jgi:hypothetical protein